ncbi:hypothetical protein DPMN_039909, partial [Dreissena polymorpha]
MMKQMKYSSEWDVCDQTPAQTPDVCSMCYEEYGGYMSTFMAGGYMNGYTQYNGYAGYGYNNNGSTYENGYPNMIYNRSDVT